MELLIIKKAHTYVRVKDGDYFFVGLDKASVFPMEMLETVGEHIGNLRRRGFEDVAIYRLTMTEEPFSATGLPRRAQGREGSK